MPGFYNVTEIPNKTVGSAPPDMDYLNSNVLPNLGDLSNDINKAAKSALDELLNYNVSEYWSETGQVKDTIP